MCSLGSRLDSLFRGVEAQPIPLLRNLPQINKTLYVRLGPAIRFRLPPVRRPGGGIDVRGVRCIDRNLLPFA